MKCCSPCTCSSFSTVEGGRGFAWRREGGKRGGERERERREGEGREGKGREGRREGGGGRKEGEEKKIGSERWMKGERERESKE